MIFEGRMHQLYCDWAQVNVYSNGSGSAEAAAAVAAANAADAPQKQRMSPRCLHYCLPC